MRLRIVALGGAGEIGRSAYLLEMTSSRILVDCGMKILDVTEDRRGVLPPNLEAIKGRRLDTVVFTHAHLDHIGCGPLVASQHPEAKLIASGPTKAFGALMLKDALKVGEEIYASPLWEQAELSDFNRRLQAVEVGKWLDFGEFALKLIPAGHVMGAASVVVRAEGKTVMFSGDISFQETPTIDGAAVPDIYPDVLVAESTNGDGEKIVSRQTAVAEIVSAVNSAVKRGGNVLLPTFALGRTQDLALDLAFADVPVFVGGLGKKVFLKMLRIRGMEKKDLSNLGIRFLGGRSHAEVLAYSSARYKGFGERSAEPKVVVAPSGWLDGGYSRFFARVWARDPKNLIVFSGFVKPGSTARRLLKTPRGGRCWFDEEDVLVKAEVRNFRMSGHASQLELTEWIRDLNPQKTVVVHGDPGTLRKFSRHLEFGGKKTTIAENGKPVVL